MMLLIFLRLPRWLLFARFGYRFHNYIKSASHLLIATSRTMTTTGTANLYGSKRIFRLQALFLADGEMGSYEEILSSTRWVIGLLPRCAHGMSRIVKLLHPGSTSTTRHWFPNTHIMRRQWCQEMIPPSNKGRFGF